MCVCVVGVGGVGFRHRKTITRAFHFCCILNKCRTNYFFTSTMNVISYNHVIAKDDQSCLNFFMYLVENVQ